MLLCLATRSNLDIIKNFEMVGQKLHRSDQDMIVTGGTQFGHDIGKVRLEPFLWSMARTLVAEHPAIGWQSYHLSYPGRGLLEMIDVIRLVLDHTFRHTVRCQQYRHTLTHIRREAIESLLHAFGQRLQEQGLEVPVSCDL